MPMSYTAQALADTTLRKLQVLANGQSASAEDVALVSDKLEGLLDDLTAREVFFAESLGEVRPAAFDHLATCLAARCDLEFGIAGPRKAELERNALMAESKLRTIDRMVSKPNDLVLQAPMGRRRLW